MENWMSKLPDDRKLVLINMPGSHDSAAFNMHCFGSCFAKTQDLDIPEQLKIGVRILDIRVTINSSCFFNEIEEEIENDTDLILCHGICNCYHIDNKKKKILTYKDVLNQVREFLIEYPSETIIFKTDSGRGNKNINLKRAEDIFGKFVGDISIEYNEKLNLGEARGKVVYTTYKSDDTSLDGIQIYNTKVKNGTGIIEIHRKHTNNNKKYDEFKVGGKLKVREIDDLTKTFNFTLEEAEEREKLNGDNFPINYETSCTGEFTRCIPLPKHEANIVNNYLMNFNFKKGNYYGWISVDFIDKLLTKKIIDTNNNTPL